VHEAEAGESLESGKVLVVPGGWSLQVRGGEGITPHVHLTEHTGSGASPGIDVTMRSVAELYGEKAIGVLLTGMGEDGAKGMAVIKARGGRTVAQNQATSLVFGMPRAAIELDVVDWVVPLDEIPDTIMKLLAKED
jgi:two-component system chemotaxis response regulator CheB